MLIDTHIHLDFAPLGEDPGAVLDRARAAGVVEVIVPAYDLDGWDAIAALAAAHENVHPAYGLHPWVADRPLDDAVLARRLREGGAVAVGEIGLDFKVDAPDHERQTAVFRRQLETAVALDLPVILHNRGAFEEMLDILGAYAGRLRGVVHAFSRGPQLARRFLDLGLYLAFGGAVTRPRARRPRRSAAATPPERILLETDAPGIGLEGVPAEETEPRHVREIALALAELRGTDLDTIARETTANARLLFRLA